MLSPQTVAEIVKAREAEEFTDYNFISEGQKIPVHKVIICSQSPVFHAACTGPFKEASGTYSLRDYPLLMVRRLVDYLYTGNYEVGASDVCFALSVHATMFALGDKYLIEGLKILSATKYSEALDQEADTEAFLRSIPDVYTMTPESARGLRDKAVWFAREKLAAAHCSPEITSVFERVTDDVPEFTKDLLRSFLQQPCVGRCSDCGRDKLVAVNVLQSRCKKCGKGGATHWG